MKTHYLALCAALLGSPFLQAVEVTGVKAHSQWPWGSDVEVEFTIANPATETERYLIEISGVANEGRDVLVAKTLADEPVCRKGTHRITWRFAKDYPNYRAADLILKVKATPYAASTGAYLVFDLSAGSTAKSYPHWYTTVAPQVEKNVEQTCKTTEMWFRRVPGGTCVQGGGDGGNNALPERPVTIKNDYYVAIFETTKQQWYQVLADWSGAWTDEASRSARPVENITDIGNKRANGAIRGNWNTSDAQAASSGRPCDGNSFVGYLRSRTGFTEIDLPTEAQWEHACRAGTTGERHSDLPISQLARMGAADSDKTVGPDLGGPAIVGSYEPNPWGLYDMYGNVLELCLDRWSASPTGVARDKAETDPLGPVDVDNNNYRVCRGGYYAAGSDAYFTSFYRRSFNAKSAWLGFRLIINIVD